MNNPTYIERTYSKFERVLNLYAARIMKTVGQAGLVFSFTPDEHLRLPPDRSAMAEIVPGTAWGSEYGNIWLSADVSVPEEADGKIFCAIPKIAASLGLANGYRVITNVGEDGCQSVKHIHFHLLGGAKLPENMGV